MHDGHELYHFQIKQETPSKPCIKKTTSWLMSVKQAKGKPMVIIKSEEEEEEEVVVVKHDGWLV